MNAECRPLAACLGVLMLCMVPGGFATAGEPGTSGARPDSAVSASPGCTQAALPTLDDLAGLAAAALCRQPAWLRAQTDVRRRLAERGVALAAWWPQIQLAVSARRDTPTPSVFSVTQTGYDHTRQHTLSLNWRLLDAGGRRADLQAASHEVAAVMAQLEAARQSTLASVALRYAELELAVTLQAIAHDAVRVAQNTLDSVRQRERHGVQSRADVLRAEAALVSAQSTRLDAHATLERAELQMRSELGLTDAGRHALHPLPAGYRGRDAELQTEREVAAQPIQPDELATVVASRERWQATVARQRAQRGALGPTVDLSLSRSLSKASVGASDPSRPRDTRMAITLNLTLLEGGAGLHRLDIAAAETRKAQLDHEENRQRATAELALRASELTRARASHTLAVALAHKQDAVRRSAEERMAVGAADLDEVLRAQSDQADALRQRAQQFAALQQAHWQWLAAHDRLSLDALRAASTEAAAPSPSR